MKLNKEPKALYDSIKKEYSIADPGGLALLTIVVESYQLMRQCQDKIDREGLTVKDKYQMKAHPLCSVLKDAKSQILASLKMLNLEGIEVLPVGRPTQGRIGT